MPVPGATSISHQTNNYCFSTPDKGAQTEQGVEYRNSTVLVELL